MARPIWKGDISFGLVSVPVNLYPGENRKELAFHLLDERDRSPIHNKRVNERTGEEVPFERIVKGYEYEPDTYVVMGDEDFRQADVEATQRIDIVDFVKADEIDPAYYDKPYYLAPTKSGVKGYALLREALERAGYVAIAKIVIRTRQHLAALIPRDRLLVLEVMRFPYEIRDTSELEVPPRELEKVGATEKELAMARQLIEAMVEPWDPERYKDTYHDDLMALIQKKVESGQLAATSPAREKAKPEEEGGKVVDIMALLKRSVEQAKEGGGTEEAARGRVRRARG